MRLILPPALAVNESIGKNTLRQIAEIPLVQQGTLANYSKGRVKGHLFHPESGDTVLFLPNSRSLPDGYTHIVEANLEGDTDSLDLSGARWLRHPLILESSGLTDIENRIAEVRHSWSDAFSFVAEDPGRGVAGLRNPQIGALHAVHAHWTVSEATATTVMPTGTGKTDTMISVMVSTRCDKILVVVPTDALRTQIADQFMRLGILKRPGSKILRDGALFPFVYVLRKLPESTDDIDVIASRSQVIVTTSQIAGRCSKDIQERLAHHCSHLFIDEAHHAEAPTWRTFKERFQKKRILQFTATPFREDGRPLDGKIVFNYPLRKAQEEGYFRTIRFDPVVEFSPTKSDTAIAEKAISQLRADFHKGHILMARVATVARAEEVFALYEHLTEFKPVQLHTGIKSRAQRERARSQIISGDSRIVVCVDMLGEGFDLPELKIAAFHDIRKSLAVTLQLAGRFTRARSDLGEATFIANVADVQVRDELQKLYTRDPDWNALLPEISETAIGEQVALQEFLSGFTDFVDEIPLNSVRPGISMVAYRTRCENWRPEKFLEGVHNPRSCQQIHHSINATEHTLVFVTARPTDVEWTEVDVLSSLEWNLFVVIWSPDQNLLFINGSNNAGEYRALAKAIAGNDVELIQGNDVFRALGNVTRLRLQNVGLSEKLGRNIRYTGRMGTNIDPGLSDAQRRHTQKTVVAGTGFENGGRVALGASRKGRIWSHQRNQVHKLSSWCKAIGEKLLDATIDPDAILRGTLKDQIVSDRPERMPIAVDWPDEIYEAIEAKWYFQIRGKNFSLSEVELTLVSPTTTGSLGFAVTAEDASAELVFELIEIDGVANYRITSHDSVSIRKGGGEPLDAAHFFDMHPPLFWFCDGSSLEGNQYVELRIPSPAFPPDRIETWDWSGIPLRRESQGIHKNAATVQARTIRKLRARGRYDVIIDDDGSGESADVVAIRISDASDGPRTVEVEFYHCKYSLDDRPGARIDDLYQVCGQAQKSIHWMNTPEKRTDLFTHLLRRDAKRLDQGHSTRFEHGNRDDLIAIREMSRASPVSLRIFIVQPGLSRVKASSEQLELLSVTETYLMETFQIKFGVIASQ